MKLLWKILAAIALGIGAGYVMPEWGARVFMTFNGIFSQFLGFLIPLLILGYVAPAIADIGSKAGKMLVATALIAYVMTVVSGWFSFGVGAWLFPKMIAPTSIGALENNAGPDLSPYFKIEMPPLFGVMSALVMAFVMGLGMAYSGSTALKRGFNEFRDIISRTIVAVIIPLLPLYILGIFMSMTMEGQVGKVLLTFISIIGIIFAMHILLLLAQFSIAGLVDRRNPLKLLKTMLPAYVTALGTQSSAATIPVTLRQVKSLGVNESVAGFVVPLCATIHMSGSAMKITACALALMIMQRMPWGVGEFAGFIFMLGITIIAAPGVPGGAIMASLGLLTSLLGFSEADNALMIALYITMDSFGTACNVTGDGAIAVIINRIFKK
ncbi:MAG: dicarboxylate/amino acid:cation symporter [Bacteroides sp.]|nr:dicarboxylate/amino acid:cation symporter [Bacteroides sp.]MCM1379290.1 dicarboxylate/amino acid:cation symporter [Bacteroides sp.]MCM1445052.1 dicarboxylate/amino acid:cation symporter [Prevotella sp.]